MTQDSPPNAGPSAPGFQSGLGCMASLEPEIR
jgi:hypothetical protein